MHTKNEPYLNPGKRIAFFGCLLDCDERHEAIREKLTYIQTGVKGVDPYEGIVSILRRQHWPEGWVEKGLLPIPAWLEPVPPPGEKDKLSAQEMVGFLDRDGCRDLAGNLGRFVREHVFPDIPCLLAVDHSLTGGVYRQVVERYAPEEVALVVLDAHTDAIPMSILAPAVQYDAETNPESVHDPEDPFLYNRPDSFNASSFLYHLLTEGIVSPRNLTILGIADYPPKNAFRLRDERIQNYVGFYQELKKAGVNLVTREELIGSPSRVRRLLEAIRTPHLYLSVDMDIGARNALEGVRFLDRSGLSELQLLRVIDQIAGLLKRGAQLTGLDLTEFNPRKAALDRTYPLAAHIIRKLLVPDFKEGGE